MISTTLVVAWMARTLDADELSARAQARDVVVTSANWRSGVTVTVGATFRVPPPVELPAWRLVYSHDALRLLTPGSRAKQPGSAGWRFEARARGQTEITFNGFAGATPGSHPNAPKFTLTVRVR